MRLLRASTLFAGVVLPLAVSAGGCGKVVLSLNGSGGDGGASSGGSSSGGAGSVASRKPLVIDKVDLLFMIDNSASMGDKQAYLEQVIPELVTRLVTPNCVDASGNVTGVSDSSGNCASSTSAPEFPPVHDMHLGIVSSSLGSRLSDQTEGGEGSACLPQATVSVGTVTVPNHNDDQAHLLTRASTSLAGAAASCTGGTCPASPATDTLSDAPEGFLDWFPSVPANVGASAGVGAPPITSTTTLENDFSDLVAGVQQYGCGIESQLESWYRFLIQPDPYAFLSLTGGTNGTAQWAGVDTTILQERRDFLRPDSAVVIVDLTDENDSEIDVRSIGGQGYFFMSAVFQPPRGASACNTNPADPACVSCDNPAAAGDPNCPMGSDTYTSPTDWGFDLNLRHVHMKQKYGIDPQYPIDRYVTGLTSSLVPDRVGEYPVGAPNYVGNLDCVNPLFAGALPDPTKLSSAAASATTLSPSDEDVLCNLPAGTRPGNAVFYLHIGGVPHELLTTVASDGSTATKTTLSDADWVRILGTDPESYDYNGIDPHMIESYAPRTAQPDGTPWPFTLATPIAGETGIQPPTAGNTADPWNGREWITNVGAHVDLNVDRQYACIFPLTTPRDCSYASPQNRLACDCSTQPNVLTATQTSPVCDATNVNQQDYAKAYPTVRELLLAKKLGPQGAVASICPIDVADNATGDDPNYGYRPAMGVLVNRVAPVLAYRGE